MSAVIEETLRLTAAAARAGRPPVWIFDIDDTVMSTAARHLRILKEFAASRGLPAPAIDPDAVRYSIIETARAAGHADEAVHRDLREFWFERFFRSDYLSEDQPIPGAPAYCRELCALGARIVYLTGRDETMREGTVAALKAHGFPWAEREASFMFKPRFDAADEPFKHEALERIGKAGPVAGGFENEPAHINLFQEKFPEGRMIFVDSRHSGRPVTPHERIPRVKNYLRGRNHG